MKKFYYLLASMAFILLVIMACEKSAIGVDETLTVKEDVLLSKGAKADKVDICHYDADLDEYYHLNISQNGWDSGHYMQHESDNLVEITGEITGDDADGDGIPDCADCNNNGVEDSEKNTWYRDSDEDGFGDPEVFIKTCVVREGYVADNTDCDDMDPAINPETIWYIDADGDGFGNPDVFVEACEAPEGYVFDNTDCDDTKYPYSPEGTYSFLYLGNYSHDYVINNFDGVNFSGTGGYPAGGPYSITEVISGTVVNGVLTGLIEYDQNDYSLVITGTVDECDGITSFDDGWESYPQE